MKKFEWGIGYEYYFLFRVSRHVASKDLVIKIGLGFEGFRENWFDRRIWIGMIMDKLILSAIHSLLICGNGFKSRFRTQKD